MLCLSQTTGYAIKALSLLASPGGEPRLLRDVAADAGVPYAYLAKRMPELVAAGLVNSKRGHHGGLILSRPAAEITLLDINEAIEGKKWFTACLLGLATCSDERACPTHQFWKTARVDIERRLRETSLADVIAHEKKLRARQAGAAG